MISNHDCDHWTERGWVAFDHLLDREQCESLSRWADEVANDSTDAHQRLHYYGTTPHGPRLCRTERFLEDHQKLAHLILGENLVKAAGDLLGREAVLYKDKINYKQPGGAGFATHQDATAYSLVKHHVTCLIAIDPMAPENDSLEFAVGKFDRLLEVDAQGCVPLTLADKSRWQAVSLPAGGVLFFNSYNSHRGGANTSNSPRRAIYLTYIAREEGDLRLDDYAECAKVMASRGSDFGDQAMRISTIGHFLGKPASKGDKP